MLVRKFTNGTYTPSDMQWEKKAFYKETNSKLSPILHRLLLFSLWTLLHLPKRKDTVHDKTKKSSTWWLTTSPAHSIPRCCSKWSHWLVHRKDPHQLLLCTSGRGPVKPNYRTIGFQMGWMHQDDNNMIHTCTWLMHQNGFMIGKTPNIGCPDHNACTWKFWIPWAHLSHDAKRTSGGLDTIPQTQSPSSRIGKRGVLPMQSRSHVGETWRCVRWRSLLQLYMFPSWLPHVQ
jgi:hypothetical protein